MSERWKPIKDYEGYYEVSNKGKVRSLNRTITYSDGRKYFVKGKYLKLEPNKAGYVQADLYKNGKSKTVYLHRLVAEAFHDNPYNKPEVNHKYGDKYDNCSDNIEWATRSENNTHAIQTGLNLNKGSNCHNSKLSECDVLEMCRLLDLGELKVKEIAAEFDVSTAYALEIRRGGKWNWLTNRKDIVGKIDKRGSNNPAAKSVRNCRGEIFGTAKEASVTYKIQNPSSITKVCKGKMKHSGKYSNGLPIKWFYN